MDIQTSYERDGGEFSIWGTKTVAINSNRSTSLTWFEIYDTGGLGRPVAYVLDRNKYFEQTFFAIIPDLANKLVARTWYGAEPHEWIEYSLLGKPGEVLSRIHSSRHPLQIILPHYPENSSAWFKAAHSLSYENPAASWPFPLGSETGGLYLFWNNQIKKSGNQPEKTLPFMLMIEPRKKISIVTPLKLQKFEAEGDYVPNFNSINLSVSDKSLILPRFSAHGIRVAHGLDLYCADFELPFYLQSLAPVAKDTAKIAVVGQTGVGKSSTINALAGKNLAKVSDYEVGTKDVQQYKIKTKGSNAPLTIYDTPGFADDLPEAGNDEMYLDMIEEKIGHIGCLIYVSRLNATRLSSDEMRTIRLITQGLGPCVWENAIIVFTMADKIENSFKEALEARSNLVRDEIKKAYKALDITGILPKIPAIAISNDGHNGAARPLPDGSDWVSDFLSTVMIQSKPKTALTVINTYAESVKNKEREQVNFTDKQKETIRKILEGADKLPLPFPYGLAVWIAKMIFN